MIETIKTIINNLTRYYQKRRIRKLVRQLPGDMRASVMHDLLGIIDIPDRLEKVRRTKEIFGPYKKQILAPYEQKMSDYCKEYSKMLDKARSNIIAPNFPMLHISINHDILEQKVKAKLTLQSLEEEIMAIPRMNKFHLFAAVLGILLSAIANFITLNMKLGNDWFGGNEVLSTCGNGLFSLLLIVFEAIGLYLLMHFMPRKLGHGLGRLIGIIGAIIIVISICIIIFSRAEIGTTAITTVHDIGKVE
ncbi:MAG: hypothetical protein AB1480_17755 [Nitrospirota bacterium]